MSGINDLQLAQFEATQASLRPWLLLATAGYSRILRRLQSSLDPTGTTSFEIPELSESEKEEVSRLELRIAQFGARHAELQKSRRSTE